MDDSIIINLKYFSNDNFIGEVVPHYKINRAILTKEAAIALSKAQKKFLEKGYSIVIYDAYRPSSSVKFFSEWMKDQNNTKRKKYHYPHIEKKSDMENIYIDTISSHSRGSTIDMSVIDFGKIYPFNNDNTIDCGTSFDLMDPASWADDNYFDFTEEQKKNRKFIRDIMESEGFKVLKEEWWHFTLINEPFPDKYFDFDIE